MTDVLTIIGLVVIPTAMLVASIVFFFKSDSRKQRAELAARRERENDAVELKMNTLTELIEENADMVNENAKQINIMSVKCDGTEKWLTRHDIEIASMNQKVSQQAVQIGSLMESLIGINRQLELSTKAVESIFKKIDDINVFLRNNK